MSTEIDADFDGNGVGDSGDARCVFASTGPIVVVEPRDELERKRAQAIGVVLDHVATLMRCTHKNVDMVATSRTTIVVCANCGSVRFNSDVWIKPKYVSELEQAITAAGDAL